MSMVLTERDLLASICRKSFFDFVREFWHTIIQEEPVWNWHIPYLCDELQTVAERVFHRQPKLYDLIINVPPGSTKSTICSVMFPAWVWTRMSHAQLICASYGSDLALSLGRKTRDIILSEQYQSFYPHLTLRKDHSSSSDFANTYGGWRFAIGAGGLVTGRHGHFLLVDDPIDPQRAVSEAEIKSVNTWMTDTLPSRKVDKVVAPTILIMQRLHQNDPTGNWLERTKGDGIRHICLPAEVTPKINPPELVDFYVDGLLDVNRLNRQVLNEFRLSGEYAYAGQMLQDPVPPGGGMFKVDRIKIEMPPKVFTGGVVRFWDKATTPGGGAFTVGAKLGLTGTGPNRLLWVLDIERGQWDSNEREITIQRCARMDGRTVWIGVEQEPGSGGKDSADYTCRNLAGYKTYIERPTGDKVSRADPLAGFCNAGALRLAPGPWNAAFIEELRYFPFSTYKDQVDAASGAFNRLTRKRIVGAM